MRTVVLRAGSARAVPLLEPREAVARWLGQPVSAVWTDEPLVSLLNEPMLPAAARLAARLDRPLHLTAEVLAGYLGEAVLWRHFGPSEWPAKPPPVLEVPDDYVPEPWAPDWLAWVPHGIRRDGMRVHGCLGIRLHGEALEPVMGWADLEPEPQVALLQSPPIDFPLERLEARDVVTWMDVVAERGFPELAWSFGSAIRSRFADHPMVLIQLFNLAARTGRRQAMVELGLQLSWSFLEDNPSNALILLHHVTSVDPSNREAQQAVDALQSALKAGRLQLTARDRALLSVLSQRQGT